LRTLRAPELSDPEIRERMSGNLCRCGAYPKLSQRCAPSGAALHRGAAMQPFTYQRAADIDAALRGAAVPAPPSSAAGTNLLDLIKSDVAQPARLIDINRLPLAAISTLPDGGLQIGARRATAIPPITRWCAKATRCSRRRCWPAPRRSCATWPPSAAT